MIDMKMERKFILSENELSELLMEAWVKGWYEKEAHNDDGKRDTARLMIERLKEE